MPLHHISIVSQRVYYVCILLAMNCTFFTDTLIENMRNGPYSLCVDGSNDTGVEKLNPLTVRIFDVNRREVTTQL